MNLLQLAVLPAKLTAAPVVFTAELFDINLRRNTSEHPTHSYYQGVVVFEYPPDLLELANLSVFDFVPYGPVRVGHHVEVWASSTEEAYRIILNQFHAVNPELEAELIGPDKID